MKLRLIYFENILSLVLYQFTFPLGYFSNVRWNDLLVLSGEAAAFQPSKIMAGSSCEAALQHRWLEHGIKISLGLARVTPSRQGFFYVFSDNARVTAAGQ